MRETKEFITPSGQKVLIKTYLTAGEANRIKSEMFKVMKITMSSDMTPEMKDMDASVILEQEITTLLVMITDINGQAPTRDSLENLRNDDYQAIVKEVNGITGNFQQKK